MAIWDIKEINKTVRSNEWVNRGERCAFAGGNPSLNTIDYISAAAGGTAVDFGDLTAARGTMQDNYGTHVRGIFAGGANLNTIDYITMATTGDATDFGDLLQTRRYVAGGGNTVRGVYGGGISPNPSNGHYNIIEFLTPTSTGNTADFGDLTQSKERLGALSSPTRLVWAAGATPGDNVQDVIESVSIASMGNGIDFGDLSTGKYGPMCASNAVRGLICGGNAGAPGHADFNHIEYITIATAGDAADFGDLTGAYLASGSASGTTRGLVGHSGGVTGLDMITISTTGNASDFGDVSVARSGYGGVSTGHGGLNVDNVQRPSVTYMPGSGRVLLQGGNAPYGGRIEKFNVTTLGGSVDFGDSVLGGASARDLSAAVGSLTRAIFAGGDTPSKTNTIDSIEFASEGNAADFGDLNESVAGSAGCSSTTRAVIGLGGNPSQYPGTIEYLTMATASNATDFGDMSVTRSGPASTGSNTRGIFAAGQVPGASNVIDYVTIASTGNATDFGDLTGASIFKAGVSSATRGVFMGGTATAHIEYVTIGSTGNGTDFGDLVNGNRAYVGGGSNSIRGVCFGGDPANTHMEYITIASAGDSTDFGDLSLARVAASGASDSHGGLQA